MFDAEHDMDRLCRQMDPRLRCDFSVEASRAPSAALFSMLGNLSCQQFIRLYYAGLEEEIHWPGDFCGLQPGLQAEQGRASQDLAQEVQAHVMTSKHQR